MKRTCFLFFVSCLSCLSLSEIPLSGNENVRLQAEDATNHTVVECRPMDPSKKEEVLKQRSKELENNNKRIADKRRNRTLSAVAAYDDPSGHGFLWGGAYHPYATHWLTSMSAGGNTVQLEDGSHWKISATAQSLTTWKLGDPLVITPNHNFWSEYSYYITNRYSGDYVAADLYIGPLLNGHYTNTIIGIDYVSGHVFLQNESAWKIVSSDYSVFADWEVGDTIIIGSNNDWFTSYDSILINVNMNNHVRAAQY